MDCVCTQTNVVVTKMSVNHLFRVIAWPGNYYRYIGWCQQHGWEG